MISRLSCGIVVYDEVSEIKRLIPHLKTELGSYTVEWVFILNHQDSTLRDLMKTWIKENIENSVCIENPANNIGFARQLILENCSEDYIYMTDPDVEVTAESVTKLIHLAEIEMRIGHDLQIVGFGGTLIYKSNFNFIQETFNFISNFVRKIPFSFQIQHHSHLVTVDHIPSCHLLLKKKVALKIGGFSPHFSEVGEDLDFSHRAYNLDYRFVFLPTSEALHFQNLNIYHWLAKVFMFGKVQITVQKLNFSMGLRYYRLLPLLPLLSAILLAFFALDLFYILTLSCLIVSVFNRGFFGFLLTVFTYSLGETFELLYPTVELKNEEEVQELKRALQNQTQKSNISI